MKTNSMGKGILALALGIVLLGSTACLGGSKNFSTSAAAASGSQTGSADQAGVKVGNTAPDFTLKDLDGNTVHLADLKGKPVLVNFWATWCPPCQQEMPDLEKAYQKYKDQGIVFLGLDQAESADTVRQFITKGGYHWTFLLDSNSQVGDSYHVTGIPETYFVDRDGVVRDFQIGAISPSSLESKIAKIK